MRLKEAFSLLKHGHAPGAYYLGGYSVECALKACIAKKTREHDFPDKKAVNESFTHTLEKLVNSAELKNDLDKEKASNDAFQQNWRIVSDWTSDHRYQLAIRYEDARDLLHACADKKAGVIPWIEKRW